MVDMVVTRLEEVAMQSPYVMEFLDDNIHDAEANITELIQDITRSFVDFEPQDVQAVVENIFETEYGMDQDDLDDHGIDIPSVMEESRDEEIDAIFMENDNHTVEAVLRLPGDHMSPACSVIGDERWIQFHQENQTDYVRFGVREIKEVNQMGQVVQSMNIGRLVRDAPISTLASDVNLGTSMDRKRALELILSYPIDPAALGACPNGGAQAYSQDTGLAEPSFLVRIYMIGKDAIEINYLGDDVLLHPYTLKYTVEIENWPFCAPENRLQVVVDYKFSEKAANTKIENIEDANIPQSNVTPEKASYDALLTENMYDLEQEMQNLMDEVDMDDIDMDFDDNDDWDNGDDDDDMEWDDDGGEMWGGKRKLQQWGDSYGNGNTYGNGNSYGNGMSAYGPGNGVMPLQGGPMMGPQMGQELGGMGAFYGMKGGLSEREIQDIMRDLPPEDRVTLMQSIVKLQSEEGAISLTERELSAVRRVMYQARLRMMRKTRQRMRREMIAIRRERYAAAAAMRLMRKRLRTMQRTFTRGLVAEGFGHTTMFMPSMGLIDGAKQEVNIKINEEGLQRLQMVVTFPYCGSKCLWDPTIEMNEDATLVPTPPPEGTNSAAIFGLSLSSLFGAVLLLLALL